MENPTIICCNFARDRRSLSLLTSSTPESFQQHKPGYPELRPTTAPARSWTEYFFESVKSPEKGNPSFNGGDAFISWLPTGEVRVYNTRGGFFDQISPLRPVFSGGPGAWELVGRFSYINLDSGPVRGGKFWRITPMVNWHMSDNVRLEFVYGYGSLNRFDLIGKTQFFQSRIQLQF